MTRPLAGLSRHNLVTELVAGVTLLAIAVPLNIGYAQIAGMPPTVGLYALIVPGVVFALVASTRQGGIPGCGGGRTGRLLPGRTSLWLAHLHARPIGEADRHREPARSSRESLAETWPILAAALVPVGIS